MKIKHTKTNSSAVKYSLIILGTAVAILIAAAYYVYLLNGNLFGWTKATNDAPLIDLKAPTDDQKKAGVQIKEDSTKNDTVSTPTNQTGGKSKVELTITAANQNDPIFQIRVLIAAIINSGVCTVSLTSPGRETVTKTSDVQAMAASSTCQGFDIPVMELSPGPWQISVDLENDSLTGSVTKSIVVR